MSAANSLTSPTSQTPQSEIDRKLKSIHPESPFGDMALALSGGGFRASAFSLGAMSYLNSAWYSDESDKLLNHVTFLTSTSGGTLPATYYSAQLHKPDFDFSRFYNSMKNFLNGELLLQEVFAILNDPSRWDEIGGITRENKRVKVTKGHNLINAFAKAYDSLLFADPTNPGSNLFGIYFNQQPVHLKTVCFNSTELNNGISFRFQTNGEDDSIRTVGNYYLKFNDPTIARKLKLGDIAATSSCFPAGFEPMCYPMDYMHTGMNDADAMIEAITYGNNDPLKLGDVEGKPFSMVDGGVVDNQGLYSMMMEDNFRAERVPEKKPFDLMMVCDVASFYVDGYQQPAIVNSWWKKLSLNKLKIFLVGCVVVFLASLVVTLCPTFSCGIRKTGFFLLLTSGLLAALYVYLWIQLYKEKKELSKSSIGNFIVKHSGYFAKLSFDNLQQMLAARLNSVLEIALSLFLNQERRQYYDTFYNMPAYQHRSLSCLIYEFSAQHDTQRKQNLKDKDFAWWPARSGCFDPSAEMQGIATRATSMATTLWFDAGPKQVMRDEIIICGQFTMCYNLLKHIYRLEVLDTKWQNDATLQGLKKRLIKDWEAFVVNARFMFT